MFKTIVDIYRDMTGDYTTNIQPKTRIKDGLRLSSLGRAQFICEIEDRFDIEIPLSALKSFKTVQNLVDYLEKNVNE
jgi:acyl carrier protein